MAATKPLTQSLLILGLTTALSSPGFAYIDEIDGEDDKPTPTKDVSTPSLDVGFEEEIDASTVIYGLDFIEAQSGVISVADLVNRIPGGSSMLNGNNNSQRGFGNGNDRILINGKRLSGKSNDSQSALSQISVNQVQRVELIRGSSPDVKVSGSGSLINVVLDEDAGGSGSWRGWSMLDEHGNLSYNGRLAYNSKAGIMDYNLSAFLHEMNLTNKFHEFLYDGSNTLLKDLKEDRNFGENRYELKANLTFNFENGDLVHLNGLFEKYKRDVNQPGDFLLPNNLGDLTINGTSLRLTNNDDRKYEIGGDYETKLSDSLSLKVLGLHTNGDFGFASEEDKDMTAQEIEPDFRFIQDTSNSESIARATLGWDFMEGHKLEIGSELAFNKKSVALQFFSRDGGTLVEQDVSSSDVTIKETRDESFLNHSWTVTDNLNVDSSLKFEYSKISQEGVNVNRSKTFTFLKPSVDIRYDISKNDQITFAVRRNISQLNFSDFASSVSDDDQVIGGNEELEPERSWESELSYEHRLADDNGSIKLKGFYEKFANKLFQIETSPGISGVGNAGEGKLYGLNIEGDLRFFFIGLRDLRLSGNLTFQNSELTDPFTFEKTDFNRTSTSMDGQIRLRHDIPKYGLAWGGSVWINASRQFKDVDEFVFFDKDRYWVNLFAEKQIGSMVLTFEIENLLNDNHPRQRYFYAGGRAGGILTSFEHRDQSWTRRYALVLKGSF